MTVYQSLIYPLLSRVDPERAHHLTLLALEKAQNNYAGRRIVSYLAGEKPAAPVRVAGLNFPNVLGVAAGFDKDARVVPGLAALGFGHIEVGTLTPRPQQGNPKPRIFRLTTDGGLINRMGFPNCGVLAAVPRLRAFANQPRSYIIGVSLGKQKDTPLDQAGEDYLTVMRAVYPFGDYLAINVSSPNTPGLRELQQGGYLGRLLGDLMTENVRLARQTGYPQRPLFLKISPDIIGDDLDDIIFAALANKIAGIIATNTTTDRTGLFHQNAAEAGGLSGRPLKTRARDWVWEIKQRTAGKIAVIGVGGIENAEDVRKMIDAGADLVQIYTGLVMHGPRLPGKILRERAEVDNWRERI